MSRMSRRLFDGTTAGIDRYMARAYAGAQPRHPPEGLTICFIGGMIYQPWLKMGDSDMLRPSEQRSQLSGGCLGDGPRVRPCLETMAVADGTVNLVKFTRGSMEQVTLNVSLMKPISRVRGSVLRARSRELRADGGHDDRRRDGPPPLLPTFG
jgi:hypothetical protein